LTPFLGFVHVWLIQESHIFKWADEKNWSTTLHQIFRVCRGHKGKHNYIILRESDDGILRGEGGRKIFDPPYLPPWGSGSAEIYLPDRDLKVPCLDKILGHRI